MKSQLDRCTVSLGPTGQYLSDFEQRILSSSVAVKASSLKRIYLFQSVYDSIVVSSPCLRDQTQVYISVVMMDPHFMNFYGNVQQIVMSFCISL
jgi:hypothetical protein